MHNKVPDMPVLLVIQSLELLRLTFCLHVVFPSFHGNDSYYHVST